MLQKLIVIILKKIKELGKKIIIPYNYIITFMTLYAMVYILVHLRVLVYPALT